jgi:Domain of unknown function (DUF4136)
MSSKETIVMLRKLLFTSFLLSFSAVATAADVRVDLDRQKDFSKYRTVSVEVGRIVRADGVTDENNTLAQDRLRRAITNELLARGIETTDGPSQLIVRVSGRDVERNENISTGWGGYPRYWRGRFGYWRPYGYWGGIYDRDVWTRRYLEGALTIDVIERETGALVYRARVTDEVGKDQDKYVVKAIDKAFKKFPVKAIAN